MVKKNDSGPKRTGDKNYLSRGNQLTAADNERRRENLIRLVGTERFPTWKSLSDALGYGDASRLSHIKNGLRPLHSNVARAMEEKLGLAQGYLDGDAEVAVASDRRRAAKKYLAREASARELAAEYGVEEAAIYRWVADFRRDEDSGVSKRLEASDDSRGIAELRAENEKLRKRLLQFMLDDD